MFRLAILAVALAVGLVSSAGAATVPVSESFESYDNGADITTTTAWSGPAGAGIITNDATAIAALATYTNAGGAFPLPDATHAKVLRISDALTNSIQSATGGVVVTDMLLMPAQRDAAPAGSTNYQFACYVNTNNQLVVWHRGASSNEWLTLANSPSMETGVWYRVSVRKAYVSQRYQVSINGGAAIEDTLGWSSAAGGGHPGSWFDMVQTNRRFMTCIRTEGKQTAYLDDVVVTNRSLSASGTSFAEAAANDGSIATTNTLTLYGDTFVNETYTSGTHFAASGVPAWLTAALSYLNPTQALVTLAGRASPHTAAASTNAMTLTLLSPAFTLGVAGDVSGYAQSGMSVTFTDPPVLAYAGAPFVERLANDGGIGNSVTITLTGDTFTNVSPLVAGTHYTTSGIPAGLSLELTANTATQLTATLIGQASPHGADSSTTFNLTFLSAAFSHVTADDIVASATNLAIQFVGSPELTYSTTVFSEAPANDGKVLGGTIAILGDLFKGTSGQDFVAAGKVLTNNLPAGLSVALTLNATSNQLTVAFSGNALSHTNGNDVPNLGFTFTDDAFLGSTASSVSNYSRGDLVVDFHDQPALTYSDAAYSEAGANDGSIGNALTITLTGDTFTNVAWLTEGLHYTTNGVPAGLGLELQVLNPTQLTARLTGNASPHDSGASGTIALSFLSAAFANVASEQIVGASANLPVSFDNQPLLTYSGDTFRESNHGAIENSLTITLSSTTGEAFAGTDGDDFAASNWVSVSPLPNALTAVVARVSSTVLSITLTGVAANNMSADNVTNMTLTFQDGAFTLAGANQVQNYTKGDLRIEFRDSSLYVNRVPYRESFEGYTNGFAPGEEQGWSPAGLGVVTTQAAIAARYPLTTNHLQVLRLNGEVSDEILSEAGGLLYSDMMLYVTAREQAPAGSASYQFAMYVDTNQHLVVWHRDTSADPSNTWTTLTGAPTVATGAWHRVTVVQDQSNFRFKLYIDGARRSVTDAAGYADATGTTHPGPWFNMVNRSGYVSRLRVLGSTGPAPGYIDDIVVDTRPPEPLPETLFLFW